MFLLAGLIMGSVVGQFKLGRLQFAEKRFSLVWSSDMLIKEDFQKMGRQDVNSTLTKPICWQRYSAFEPFLCVDVFLSWWKLVLHTSI